MRIKPAINGDCIVGHEIELPCHEECKAKIFLISQTVETNFEFINASGFRWKLKISDIYRDLNKAEEGIDPYNPDWYFEGVDPTNTLFRFSIWTDNDNDLFDFIYCAFNPDPDNSRSIFTRSLNRVQAFTDGFKDGCLLMDNLVYIALKKVKCPDSDHESSLAFRKPSESNGSLNLYLDKSSPCGYRLENEGDENILTILNDLNVFTDPRNTSLFESLALLHDMV